MYLERDILPTERTVRVDGRHSTNSQPIESPRGLHYASCKSLAEASLTLLLLLPAVPMILLAALLVKLSSRGPIFYSQRRVGRDRKSVV